MKETTGVFDPYLQKWWASRSSEERATLIGAAEASEYRLDDETHQLLRDTRCPVGAVGTQFDMQPEIAWSWSPDVREFIIAQR